MSKLRHSNIVLYMGVCAEPPCLVVRLPASCCWSGGANVARPPCLISRSCCLSPLLTAKLHALLFVLFVSWTLVGTLGHAALQRSTPCLLAFTSDCAAGFIAKRCRWSTAAARGWTICWLAASGTPRCVAL